MSKKKGLTPLCLALAASLAAPLAMAQSVQTQDNIDSTNIGRGQISAGNIYLPSSTVPPGATVLTPPTAEIPTPTANPGGSAAPVAQAPAPAPCHQYCYVGSYQHDGPN